MSTNGRQTEFVLIRHGATALNAQGRFQGQSDIALSHLGVAQAQILARVLAHDALDAVVASDLVRAVETARALAQAHGLPVKTDVRLREFDFGKWEGLTWSEIVARWPAAGAHNVKEARSYAPEGGETFEAVCARVASFLEDSTSWGYRRLAVVTHAGVLHALIRTALGKDFDATSLRFDNGSVTRLAMEGGRARLISLNDVSHFDHVPDR